MECHCLPLRELPHTTKLFAAYIEDFQKVTKFYERAPTEEGVAEAASTVKLEDATRRSVVEILREQNQKFGSGAAAEKNLEKLDKGAVAIVSGQQTGLFSGPAYSFYKALTAIRWAERLTARGISAVPVFWLASEDHDFAEVNHAYWASHNGIDRLEISDGGCSAGKPVGDVKFTTEINALVEKAAAALSGPHARVVERALRESYAPGETFASAFGKLMARAMTGRGLILIDPTEARLHRIAAPIYKRAISEADELRGDLLARKKELDKSGYHAQVKVTAETTLLFTLVGGRREPVRRKNGKFMVSGTAFTSEEMLTAIEKKPELFSANVLLRAIVQDTLLPTAAYIGGPAEVAYMAQGSAVYKRLLGRMPAILPRAGFTLVEPSVARLLKKYGLQAKDAFRGSQVIHAALAAGALPRGLAGRFARDEKVLLRRLAGYLKPLGQLDETLLGALRTAETKMMYQFGKLRRKAGQAEGFRTGILERHEQTILNTLYPQKAPQERALCFLPFLATYGVELMDEIARRADDNPPQHHILYL